MRRKPCGPSVLVMLAQTRPDTAAHRSTIYEAVLWEPHGRVRATKCDIARSICAILLRRYLKPSTRSCGERGLFPCRGWVAERGRRRRRALRRARRRDAAESGRHGRARGDWRCGCCCSAARASTCREPRRRHRSETPLTTFPSRGDNQPIDASVTTLGKGRRWFRRGSRF